MKSIRVHWFGGPEVLQLEETENLQPGPNQVLLQVKAAGVNPVDTYIRSGVYAHKPDLPYTPGQDAAGIVESVGEEVTEISPGTRVYTSGTISGAYAEQVLCHESQVHPLPEPVTYAQGAATGIPYATAYRALYQCGGAEPGNSILVHGASGGVGVAAVQLARAGGMTVIGTAGSENGRALVTEQGAHHVLDHGQADYLKQVMALTGGRGVNIVLEMLANVNLPKDLKMLAMHGRLVIIGSRGSVEIDPRDVMRRDATVIGMLLFNASQPQMNIIHAALAAGLANRTLRPVVGRELPLADAPRAHEAVMHSPAYGKIVLIP